MGYGVVENVMWFVVDGLRLRGRRLRGRETWWRSVCVGSGVIWLCGLDAGWSRNLPG